MTLTPRQAQVAELIYAGRTRKQIAAELGMSAGTVQLHVGHIRVVLRLPPHVPMVDLPQDYLREKIDAHRRAA